MSTLIQIMFHACKRRSSRLACTLIVPVLFCTILAVPRAQATEWTICNSSAENVAVAIVFGVNDARQYVSKGWWNLPPGGGCKVVFAGDLSVTGAFLRAEGSKGSVWEGHTLFCTSQVRFELPANLNDRACAERGSRLKGYQMHVISKPRYTTTLNGPRQETHGFGDDNVGVPAY